MNSLLNANKQYRFDFYSKVMQKLKEIDISHGMRLIPLPLVYYKIGCNFRLKKQEIKLVLMDLTDEGKIEFHAFNGIKILSDDRD